MDHYFVILFIVIISNVRYAFNSLALLITNCCRREMWMVTVSFGIVVGGIAFTCMNARNMSSTSSAHALFPHKMFVVSMRGMGWPTCQDLDSIFFGKEWCGLLCWKCWASTWCIVWGEGKVKSGNSLCYTSINFQNMVVRERGHSSWFFLTVPSLILSYQKCKYSTQVNPNPIVAH